MKVRPSREGDKTAEVEAAESSPTAPDRVQASQSTTPHNPGAEAFVGALVKAIGIDDAGPTGPLVVIRPFRNQSRGTAAELEDLRNRLFKLLSNNAEPEQIRFALEATPEAEYTLGGTVYLLTRDGFDFWEAYVALRPAGANWTLWRNDQPIRLLRQARMEADSLLFSDDSQQ